MAGGVPAACRSLGGAGGRQQDRERCAPTRSIAPGADPAVVGVDERLDDGEPQPETPMRARAPMRHPGGTASNTHGRNSGAIPLPVSLTVSSTAVARPAQRDANRAALRRELDRVRQEIERHLLKPGAVAEHLAAGSLEIDDHLDTLGLRGGQHDLDCIAYGRVQVDERPLEAKLAGRDARHVEQVFDQLRLPPGAVPDAEHRAIAQPLVEAVLREHVGPPENRIQAACGARATRPRGTDPSAGSPPLRSRARPAPAREAGCASVRAASSPRAPPPAVPSPRPAPARPVRACVQRGDRLLRAAAGFLRLCRFSSSSRPAKSS